MRVSKHIDYTMTARYGLTDTEQFETTLGDDHGIVLAVTFRNVSYDPRLSLSVNLHPLKPDGTPSGEFKEVAFEPWELPSRLRAEWTAFVAAVSELRSGVADAVGVWTQ